MKHYLLQQLSKHLSKYPKIHYIKRVDNNTIKIQFNKDDAIFFDMIKGGATAYIKQNSTTFKKDFKAPFDIVLQKKFTTCDISKVYLKNNDKILNIEVYIKSKYKKELLTLSLEFTGKNTNIIIIDENNIILEALRHIDEYRSIRVVKVGLKLEDLTKPTFKFELKKCDDIVIYLKNLYITKEEKLLENIKKQKIVQLEKQKQKIDKILKNLDDVKVLKQKSDDLYNKGNLILSNIHKIKNYETSIKAIDFQGNQIEIELNTKYPTPSVYANYLFTSAKKLKQKAKYQYLEEKNLSSKIEFYNRMINTIDEQTSIQSIEFYLPKKDKKQTTTKKAQPYQSFFIDGYKIMLGRDERENIYLLHNSKASDFWFHLQGETSSHVIVVNTKKELPKHIIEEAANICARFSKDNYGVYTVDFTQRRNIKIQSKANVLYNPYNTIRCQIKKR
jgi:predicted ribosome quality control (RQC) complex YloA/Tae2 family protein